MRLDWLCRECGAVMPGIASGVVHHCHPSTLRDQGAAVAFGLMGMAEAIRWNYLCYDCGKHVGTSTAGPFGIKCWCSLRGDAEDADVAEDDRRVEQETKR